MTLTADGQTQSYETKAKTVGEFLQEIDFTLAENDLISTDTSAKLTDNAELTVSRALSITVNADWQTTELHLQPCTVAEALAAAGVSVSTSDKVTPEPETLLNTDSTITVNRIVYHSATESVRIAPEVVRHTDSSLAAGTTKIVQEGKAGEEKVTYSKVYKDGQLVDKIEVSRVTVSEAQDRVISVGTMKVASRSSSARSETASASQAKSSGSTGNFSYSDSFTVTATAYSGGGRTASGTKVAPGTIAVDPSVIPLGTKLYVEGYGYGTALDTGGAIKGKKIDVYFNSESSCNSWGRKKVKVYILD